MLYWVFTFHHIIKIRYETAILQFETFKVTRYKLHSYQNCSFPLHLQFYLLVDWFDSYLLLVSDQYSVGKIHSIQNGIEISVGENEVTFSTWLNLMHTTRVISDISIKKNEKKNSALRFLLVLITPQIPLKYKNLPGNLYLL